MKMDMHRITRWKTRTKQCHATDDRPETEEDQEDREYIHNTVQAFNAESSVNQDREPPSIETILSENDINRERVSPNTSPI